MAFLTSISSASLLARGVESANGRNYPAATAWSAYENTFPLIPMASAEHPYEYVILCGGPSLIQWEKYKTVPHDMFWACFIRAARTRIQQLQMQIRDNPNAMITLLIYLDSYRSRGLQEKADLLKNIYSVRDKYRIHLVPVRSGGDVITYLNQGKDRNRVKIADLEYFGHSNRCAFMFDYSNNIDSASKAWLHEDSFKELRRDLFAKNAYIKSWGCHTGESMSQKFYKATGKRMIGAIGRTDFSSRDELLNGIVPSLSSGDGKWVD